MLEGMNVNLKIVEKEDLSLFTEWGNDLEFFGEFVWLTQQFRTDREKWFDGLPPEARFFFVEKKDGTKIGTIAHFLVGPHMEIGYMLVSNERGKGYCSEAATIMVDYLFLSKNLERVQATTDVDNLASQRVLEKVGFKNEGVIRKSAFIRGKWRDCCLFSILREEWKEPRIVGKT